jgi:hypothetical protein
MDGLFIPKIRRNACESWFSQLSRHAQSTSCEDPCSKRGDHGLILPGTALPSTLRSVASSNSMSRNAFETLSPLAASQPNVENATVDGSDHRRGFGRNRYV